MDKNTEIAIIGASPIACILAAALHTHGRRVTVVDDDESTVSAIRKDGLQIEGLQQLHAPIGALYASVDAVIASGVKFEFIFVCAKTDAMRVVAAKLPAMLADDGVAIRFKNGLDTEKEMVEILGPQRCLKGAINFAGSKQSPGEIQFSFFEPPNFIGAAIPGEAIAEQKARDVVTLLNEAQLESDYATDVRTQTWQTVIRHAAVLPVSALTGMDVAQVLGSPRGLFLVKSLLTEAIAVAAKVGFHFDEKFHYETLTYFLKAGHHMPSMWQDIQSGRPTEIGVLNHKIAEYGESYGVPVPCQRSLANLVLCIDELTGLDHPGY